MFNLPKFSKHNLFVVSDLHFHHDKLVKSRGFETLDAYNAAIIRNWNQVVNDDSTVFVLGDTVLGAGENSYNVFCTLLNVLKYHTLYIAGGNHTAAIRRIFNDNLKAGGAVDEFYRLKVRDFQRNVYIIPNYYEIFVGGQHVVLSHYPILSFNGMGRDSIHLHGHSHSSLKKNQWINDNYLTAKVLDVGLENTMLAPLSYLEIEKIMEIKENKTFDHH